MKYNYFYGPTSVKQLLRIAVLLNLLLNKLYEKAGKTGNEAASILNTRAAKSFFGLFPDHLNMLFRIKGIAVKSLNCW
jgi:hypothetical protein